VNARFWTVVLLLVGTAALIRFRGNTDRIPDSEPLAQIPMNIAGWLGNDMQIDPETLDVLGAGDFLSRMYARNASGQGIELFVGYFPTQRTGVSVHSPRNCLPGSGWTFESSDYLDLRDVNGKAHHVGEYIVTDGESREFVIYWYQAHGRSIANEYLAKMYLAMDAMRTNRTDGALVRVATPISPAESSAQARMRAEAFTSQLTPMLPRFIPD
jgi:EpsI family protein